jgi:hypothetical protein
VAVHKVLGDLVRNALIAQGRNQPVEQGRRIPAADRFPKVLTLRSKTRLIDKRGGTSDAADLENQSCCMSQRGLIPVVLADFAFDHRCSNHRHQLSLGVGVPVDVPLGRLN